MGCQGGDQLCYQLLKQLLPASDILQVPYQRMHAETQHFITAILPVLQDWQKQCAEDVAQTKDNSVTSLQSCCAPLAGCIVNDRLKVKRLTLLT